jgi:hypothetical protein
MQNVKKIWLEENTTDFKMKCNVKVIEERKLQQTT